jgi:hypothetical protein
MKLVRQTLIALLMTGVISPSVAWAAAPNTGQALEISPPVIELSANPGQTITTNIKIRDVSNSELIVRGKADDFGAGDENGNPKVLLDEKEATRYSLKYWIAGVPDLRLVPREIKTVTVKIVVPKNAEPGGHYGVVRFTGTPPGLEGQGVSLSASIGALILLRVSGPVSEKIELVDFYAMHGLAKGGLFERGPIMFVERLKNLGTVHVKPTGSMDIFDTFGNLVDVVPINQPPRNILPDSIRKFEQPWNKRFLIGRYRARVNLSYGSQQKPLVAATTFWVIPYKLILLTIIILTLLFFTLRRAIRNYNRRIIAKARKKR